MSCAIRTTRVPVAPDRRLPFPKGIYIDVNCAATSPEERCIITEWQHYDAAKQHLREEIGQSRPNGSDVNSVKSMMPVRLAPSG